MKTAKHLQNPFSRVYKKQGKLTHYLESFYNNAGILYVECKHVPYSYCY
ncbi:MAG: hypothetical protein QM499_10355 [Flavobacteriaceae bacterium]